MSRGKYLAKNIGLLTISQFGTKLLSFFLVPIYTRVLSTTEYGTYDLFHTSILLLVPFLTSNISDATLRFPLDNPNHSDVFKISLRKVVRGIFIALILLLVNRLVLPYNTVTEYDIFIFGSYVSSSLSVVLINYSRGIEGIKEVAIGGIISSAVLLSLNIVFLIPLHLGLYGYFLANIIGSLAQSFYLFISLKMWKSLKNYSEYDRNLEKDMVVYSRPLMANNVAWWVNSSSDRYIVTWLCGYAVNGVYAVGYKIPSILNVFQTIFNQAWTLSAVKDFDKNDSNGFFTNMYNLYNGSMILICSILIICTRIIAKILYAREFYEAWIFVPVLLISVLFGALSGYIGGVFAAVKDSKIFAQTTILSAIVNTILNLILVYYCGALGAAIATLVAYWLTWLIRMIKVKKYINLRLNMKRDWLAYIILIIQTIVMLTIKSNDIMLYVIQSFLLILLILLFRKQAVIFMDKFKQYIRKGVKHEKRL